MRCKLLAWIIVMVLLAAAVSALGISPGQRLIDFSPNTRHTIQFNLINDQQKDIMLIVYALGELNTSVRLPTQLVVMPSDESSKMLSYEVELPKEMAPGDHAVEVILQEINPPEKAEGVSMQTQLAVATRLIVRVPYPEKYLDVGKIEVLKEPSGELEFRLPVQNFGKKAIGEAKAEFTVKDVEGKEVAKLESEVEMLDSGERALLKAKWAADVEHGEYSVIAKVAYDDDYKTSEEKWFEVGVVDIEILGIETKNFNLGQVAKVDITMVSRWNKELKDAYVSMEIKDESGEDKAEIKTPSFNLLPYKQETVAAYWDTAGFDAGKYYITLEVHFLDKSVVKRIIAELSLNQLSFGFLDATGNVVAASGKIDKTTILSVLVVLLIAINVMWFVYTRRRGGRYDTIDVGVGGEEKEARTKPAISHDTLVANIRKAKEKKAELVRKVEEFKKQYSEERLTYAEYEYKLNHYLRGKDIEYWKKYYDDYVKDAGSYLKESSRKDFARPPEGP